MIDLGEIQISYHNFGSLWLDGGAMFGSVPKNLWAKKITPDEENRIELATNCLLIYEKERIFLVDVGVGDKMNEKLQKIYNVQNRNFGLFPHHPDQITDIILTHLHFDHAGGISYIDSASGENNLRFPKARVHLQKSNYELALAPNIRERASYLKENIEPLSKTELNLIDQRTHDLTTNIKLHRIDGHTSGQQIVEVIGKNRSLIYLSDLCPTSHHLPLAYHMGYDMCAATLIEEKKLFLSKAAKENIILFFEHDTTLQAATIKEDEKVGYVIDKKIDI
ncbi:MAG TPA: MBL fold metallo-hydrolase [Oligoflexia bacterium]|nr:MBL fold metallo-hydrolase [Oligoflexia bacterium]HMP26817.1 MBL fold metallo-hydrolase [Oligoflexia bacterium]